MDKIKSILHRPQVWGFFVSVVVMALVSLAFFYPDSVEGNVLRQHDMQQGLANGHEGMLFAEQTGEKALWTNSLFSGMPTFQISPSYPSNSLFEWINDVYGLWLPAPSNLLFMMMLGFLILLYTLRLRWYYALLGAIAWGFSSYFVIIIGAGHIWKFLALTYIPPTIGGLILLYRGRYAAGTALMALFMMLQLNANHPQMTYYFAFVMLALAVSFFIESMRLKTLRRWAMASGLAVGATLLAVGANLPSLYNTYEYAKETKRSQSELTPLSSPDRDGTAAAERPTGGLPRGEIVGWSYGGSEMFSLLVPNIKGGATAVPEQGGMVYAGLDRLDGAEVYEQKPVGALLPYLPQYFNDSEGTNGPVYVGAIIVALFLLGCVIVKGPLKWALLSSTVLSVLLALGANFGWLTDLMIYHFPLYNKFRAVESILVIAEFTMPLLAVLALHKLFTTPDAMKVYRKAFYACFGTAAVVCLFTLIYPGAFGDFITTQDKARVEEIVAMYANAGYDSDTLYSLSLQNPENVSAIESLRSGMVRDDAWRSLLFVLLGGAFVFLGSRRIVRPALAVGAVGVLVLFDLYGVDKRYVSHSSFCTPSQSAEPGFRPDAFDKAILEDKDLSYRVLDIPGFGSADRSYFHKMVGGYHAAKLNRYEDLIQRQINPVRYTAFVPELRDTAVLAAYSPEEQKQIKDITSKYQVLDMLNTRYVITGDKERPLVYNPYALGNGWFVGSVEYVDGADAEMAALDRLDLSSQAVADSRFKDALSSQEPSLTPGDTIELVSYTPNTLRYRATTATGGIGVFSEVYFPWGWHAYVDGAEVPLARVNYILRAMAIPAGTHEIEMTFSPASLGVTGSVAYACVTLIYMLLLFAIFTGLRRCCLF